MKVRSGAKPAFGIAGRVRIRDDFGYFGPVLLSTERRAGGAR